MTTTRRRRSFSRFLFGALLAAGLAQATQAETSCTPTGFFRDSINMTASLINPPGTVSGVVDATGCNVGVYYGADATGQIVEADIHGANYFGVLVNGDAGEVGVDILNSHIHDIGEVPLNGTQHGVAIYYRAFFAGGGATGRIAGNVIEIYQKGGIVVNGVGAQAMVSDNTIVGAGHVDYIAQNGIQVGYGATASVMRNSVTGNSYVGFPGDGSASGGILVVGGAGYGLCPDGNACPYTVNARIVGNVLIGNDVGVFLSNLAGDLSAPASATNVKAVNNEITNTDCFNTSYQAGISDVGNNDKAISNTISGDGYEPPCGFSVDADVSFTNRPKVHANK